MPTRYNLSLDYLPVGLFGSVMGLTGLVVAWRLAHTFLGAPLWIATAIGRSASSPSWRSSWAMASRRRRLRRRCRRSSPIPSPATCSAPSLSACCSYLSPSPHSRSAWRRDLWVVGAIGMVAFAWLMVTRWMSDRQQVAHATPAWIISVVGLLDVPLALPSLDLPPMQGLMVASLAIGLFFAIPVFTLLSTHKLRCLCLQAHLAPATR